MKTCCVCWREAEGIAAGPKLPDGTQTVMLVCKRHGEAVAKAIMEAAREVWGERLQT